MKRNQQFITALFGAALMIAPAHAMPRAQSGQTASQDMKNAGQDTKDAAKDTGNGVKKGTKKAATGKPAAAPKTSTGASSQK